MNPPFWKGRRVFITGHTGFKGSWLSLWLANLGAKVTGYSLPPQTDPSLFDSARVADVVHSIAADVRDAPALDAGLRHSEAEVVFHLAAQAIVRRSYVDPLETFSTNVMGTANLLQAVRHAPSVKAVVVVTSDKCYENLDLDRGYVESDVLGGYDPYSSSKACAEIITAAFRRSFFTTGAAIATVRAGNVIGGGDWSENRLLPDMARAFLSGKPALIRNPDATRPWQHVLDPLSGYLLLAERLYRDRAGFARSWNFGPDPKESVAVRHVVDQAVKHWGGGARWETDHADHPHEARVLALNADLANRELGWIPRLDLSAGLAWTIQWYRTVHCDRTVSARAITLSQIEDYGRLA
jgi:CDP-glucose 4,6-dehydratase